MSQPARRGLALGLAALAVLAVTCVVVLTHQTASQSKLVSSDASIPGARLLAEALRDEAPRPKGARPRHPSSRAAAHKHPGSFVSQAQRAKDQATWAKIAAAERSAAAEKKQGAVNAEAAAAKGLHVQEIKAAPKDPIVDEKTLEAEEKAHEQKHARKVVLELAQANLSESFDKLKLARDLRARDGMQAKYLPFLGGKFGRLMEEKKALVSRERLDIDAAKALESRAQSLSQDVVKNLNVHNGKFSLAEWYRNGGALRSSQQSTDAVASAKRMWARVVADQRALRRIEANPLFEKHATQLAGAQIVMKQSRENLRADRTKLDVDRARVAHLTAERQRLAPFLAAAKPVPSHPAAAAHDSAAVKKTEHAVKAATSAAPVAAAGASKPAAASTSGQGSEKSRSIADSVRFLASTLAKAVGFGGVAAQTTGDVARQIVAGKNEVPKMAAAVKAPAAAAQAAVKAAVKGAKAAASAAAAAPIERAAQPGPHAAVAPSAGKQPGARGRAALAPLVGAEGGRPAREQELASVPAVPPPPLVLSGHAASLPPY